MDIALSESVRSFGLSHPETLDANLHGLKTMKAFFRPRTMVVLFFISSVGLSAHAQNAEPSCAPVGRLARAAHWVAKAFSTHKDEFDSCYGPFVEEGLRSSKEASFVEKLFKTGSLDRAIQGDQAFLQSLDKDPTLVSAYERNGRYKKILLNGPSLRFLYGEPSGVGEGYTIGQHTVRVLQVYQEQRGVYQIARLPIPRGMRSLDLLMSYTLAFHDIGKSIAYRGGDKGRETVYSVPLASDLLAARGFTPPEVRLGAALIDQHQVIGQYLQGRTDLETAVELLREGAKAAGVDEKLFFQLSEMVFVADAASYPFLRDRVFQKDEQGKLVPRGETYRDLVAAFE